ncbi:MAG: peptidyl-prolyl cis-trans isomerase, partial [Woeseiaceae bacterium]|nr:peptidyl-prolyl cis-trans isomerase [Woeseiaceae bacterium]
EGELKTRAADDRFVELERTLADALFDADNLETMAQSTGLQVAQATGFTRSGGEPFGASQAVIDAVFDNAVLLDGQISDVIEIDRNRSVVIQVTEYHPEARKSLDEVRDEIRFNLQSERALELIRERGRQFQAAVQEGKAFAAAAAEFDAQAISNVLVERQAENVDPAIVRDIFRTKKPEPGNVRLAETMSSTGDFVVFMISDVIPGRPEAIPLADRDARKEQLQTNYGAADFTAFVNELELRADIERSEEALQQDMFQ